MKKSAEQAKINGNNPIAAFLDKEPASFTRGDIARFALKNGIKLLVFAPVTGNGRLKALTFPITGEKQLNEILDRGERVDGSSHFPGLSAERSDIYIVPRFSTAFVHPFSEIPALVVLTACYGPDERPFHLCPYWLVKRAYDSFVEAAGYKTRFLGELEFYLIGSGEPQYAPPAKLYHESIPFVHYAKVCDEAIARLSDIGITVKYGHAEVGGRHKKGQVREQHEIEMNLEEPIEAADHLAVAKWVVRNAAARHGVMATFAPKIDATLAGSGLHFHFQIMDGQKNILFDETGAISEKGLAAIGGLLKYTAALTAFGNTVPTSYLRFAPGMEAPTKVSWGEGNRSALIRIPLGWLYKKSMSGQLNPIEPDKIVEHSDRRTFEFRAPDGSADVPASIAGIITALRIGFESAEQSVQTARDFHAENVGSGAKPKGPEIPPLPSSCWESASALENARKAFEEKGVFHPGLLDLVLKKLRNYKDQALAVELRENQQKLAAVVEEHLHCG
jgi:glutamine synthetase